MGADTGQEETRSQVDVLLVQGIYALLFRGFLFFILGIYNLMGSVSEKITQVAWVKDGWERQNKATQELPRQLR